MLIVNPLRRSVVLSLFSTRPPIEERIRGLKGVATRQGTEGARPAERHIPRRGSAMFISNKTLAKTFCYPVTIALCILVLAASIAAPEKQIVGWIEKVRIHPGNLVIHAKLDTGPRNSSLNTSHVTEFRRDGKRWVRFEVINRDRQKVIIEQKVQRVARIRCDAGGVERRLVIRLGICLGNIFKEVEVNLADRSGFKYQMLIGRSFLAKDFIVDPSLEYTRKLTCEGAPKR